MVPVNDARACFLGISTDGRPPLLDPGVTLRSMMAAGRGVDGANAPTSGDPEKRVWPSCLGGGKPGDMGAVRDIGDWQCVGRATDEPVLAGPTAAAGNPAGRPCQA